MKIDIITGYDVVYLRANLQSMIDQGWRPQGGLAMATQPNGEVLYAMAVILYPNALVDQQIDEAAGKIVELAARRRVRRS